jgi:phage shock protein A
MNLLERVLTLLRANLNAMAEKSEDPEKVLRQLQLDMRNQLVQVKTQVATAIAEGMKLQKHVSERQAEAAQWLKKAELAIQQKNEQAARDFLARYNGLNRQAERYQQQQKEQEQQAATMRGILRRLEAKITEVDTTIELLAARKRSALLQQRVYDTLSKSGSPKDKERALRAQDALFEIEARARALAEIEQQGLDAQLEQLAEERLIDAQLAQLKGQQIDGVEPPLLAEGNARRSSRAAPSSEEHQTTRKNGSASRREATGPLAPASHDGQELDLKTLRNLAKE